MTMLPFAKPSTIMLLKILDSIVDMDYWFDSRLVGFA